MVRLMVSDVPFTSTSTSPDWSPENRCDWVYGTNSTLVGSPRTATAMALQQSTSNPCHSPASLGVAKPAAWEMPHFTAPRARTLLSVGPPATVLLGGPEESVVDSPLDEHAISIIIPSGAAQRRRRGIALVPTGGRVP